MNPPDNFPLLVHSLGVVDYHTVWQQMQEFTNSRDQSCRDELWLVQHPPVFTQGQAGKPEHLLDSGEIPVVQSDRGGQVTYHGPGQLVAYPLVNLRRLGLGVRDLVTRIENSVIEFLANYNITAVARADAPGVYVADCKIASLGLRVRKGCSFHGVAININVDLEPFQRINPCGYAGLQMTRLQDLLAKPVSVDDIAQTYVCILAKQLELNPVFIQEPKEWLK